MPNVEVCLELQEGAQCVWTVQGPNRRLSKLEWDAISLGRVSQTAQDYGKIRLFIEKACEVSKKCKLPELKERLKALEAGLCVEEEECLP